MKKNNSHFDFYIKLIIVIGFTIIILSMNKCFMNIDDEVFREFFSDFTSFKHWLKDYYSVWSGRIITSALGCIFLRLPLTIYRVCNTLVYIVAITTIVYLVKIYENISKKEETLLLFSIFAISFLIDYNVLFPSIIWVTGSFIYLWPTAFMMVSLIPFIKLIKKVEIKKQYIYIIYILSSFIACFSEQTALVLLCFGGLTIAYSILNKEKPSKLLVIHYLIIIILSLIELLAPGNFARALSSTLRRYPTFYMLNFGDKLLEGIIVFQNQMLNMDTTLMICLTLLIAINSLINKKSNGIVKITSIISFIYYMLVCIGKNINLGEGILYNIPKFGIQYIYGVTIYIPILLFIINMILILISIVFETKNIKENLFTGIVYLASIASALSISFSPTIYASESRVFFVTDYLILILIGLFIAKIVTNYKINNKIGDNNYGRTN